MMLGLVTTMMLSSTAEATVPHRIVVPDVEGYLTLKGDFHIHTIFSDATVWPVTRVDEAGMDGLDFISITDHMDHRLQKNKNKGLFNCDRNESYKIASSVAKSNHIMVIHGGEITRAMSPGHFNTQFITDCEAIGNASDAQATDYDAMVAGLEEARRQGAFCIWNHPHWERQAPNETVWYPEHTKLYEAGLMQGIEIYNSFAGYSPEAHHWAVEHNLTITSGTDCHRPLFLTIDYLHGELRPVTLVFAKERSQSGIREALEAHRTAVFADGKVYGSDEVLQPLMKAVLEVSNVKYSDTKVSFTIVNRSSIPLVLTKAPGSEQVVYKRELIVQPFAEMTLTVTGLDNKKPLGVDQVDVNFYVTNFFVDADKPMHYQLHFEKPKQK
jgi:hypothetical protein